ncbi:MAG: hypothetical protein KKB31_05685 [Nanoarchaeota archaeon]|nr:hypothetical protein [Nanoarchaeota archaeon]
MGILGKIDIKKFALSMLFSLILITILSTVLSSFTDIPIIKSGTSFIIIFIGVYITLIFSVAHDWKFESKEIWLLVFVAGALIASVFALKEFFPQIFSILPDATKNIFSALGI